MRTIRLSKAAIEAALLVNGKRTEYAIEGNLRQRVIKNKTCTTFEVRYNAFNKRFRKRLGLYPDMSLADFTAQANAFIQQVNQSNGQLDTRLTLDDFFNRYYLPRIRVKKITYKDDVSKFNRCVSPHIGKTPLTEIRTHHLQRVLDRLPAATKPATYNRYRAFLFSLFGYACNSQLIGANPCAAIPLLQENNINERYLSEAEGLAFIQACLTEKDNPAVLALMLAYYTGLRIGNARTLKREHLSEGLTSITLLTKVGRDQTFPLSRYAQGIIRHALSLTPCDYLFPSPVNPDKPISHPRSAMVRICKKAGIAVSGEQVEVQEGFSSVPVNIHSLRKTFSNRVMAKTGNIYACSELLGHSSIEVTRRYLSIKDDEKRLIVDSAFEAHALPSERVVWQGVKI